jgi:hypothetical protein
MNNISLMRILTIILVFSAYVYAQYPERQDVIWARNTVEPIVLDGNLNEASWALAESLQIDYKQPGKLPTSGWKAEFNENGVTDPTRATVKFLASGNQLFIGFYIPDSSVGGSIDWARWDGILMSIKDKLSPSRPSPAAEFFYTYWYVNTPQYAIPGGPARFIGKYGNFNDTTRTDAQRAAWDAASVVLGGQSNDAGRDQAWVVEMRISVDSLGYNLIQPEGDIVMLNFSIWDCDFLYEGIPGTINSTRTHFQSPWGNANANNVARVHVRPEVNTSTSTLPIVNPDIVLQNGANFPSPIIDGNIDDDVWLNVSGFEIAWDDLVIRDSYPGVGPYQSGQFQPLLAGQSTKPPVIDPSYGKIKIFFKDNFLYLAANISDQIVQGNATYDEVDGIGLMIGDRNSFSDANNMEVRLLRLNFSPENTARAYDYMTQLLDSTNSQFAFALKGATTVGDNSDIDEGFTVELKVDLTGLLGYSQDLGDGLIFLGVVIYDGDTFDDPLNNYGTRTWWFRETSGGPALAWGYMDPNNLVDVKDNHNSLIPNSLVLYGNYPNPFNPSTTIKFSSPSARHLKIEVYNVLGQSVLERNIFITNSGEQEYKLDLSSLTSGVYIYKLSLNEEGNAKLLENKIGKMILMK